MSDAISDFMVHVGESLSAEQIRKMEARVRDHHCVISAAFPQRTPHLMMVVYDSECTHAKDILGHVRASGAHATML
ncbi:MAG: hypothetical protein COW48_11170 [Hydrogenophilales bacterium CG17_big_fil_post_rev_8_21_14_2_50_63_12]|nr:MAG: hypothetical protein COW48_11170 [Hydrogenophilales bacterium CG17_big_fil_post_rev_8_21_14_2_50_63_12]PIX96142.1 MAG: hypothetical protein COZ24_12105 [Hydrogenophilales bacterium CG_4_10_14_3_um_filter_63_21]PJB04597.1 MAG: hypothetical protein CO126_04935 [Hydrogenophilales bacterium CG_4_9_14_3_um_filter_63_34]